VEDIQRVLLRPNTDRQVDEKDQRPMRGEQPLPPRQSCRANDAEETWLAMRLDDRLNHP
jgi:hypothetical protein